MGQIHSLEKAYQVLKCSPGAASEEVERCYKATQKQYQQALYDASDLPSQYTWLLSKYPDLSSLIGPKAPGLPDEYLAVLTRKLREVNEAYETIAKGTAAPDIPTVDFISDQGLLAFFGRHSLDKYYFVAPHIPDGRLSNAIKKSELPTMERVLALFDCTLVFSNASNHLLLTRRGLYYREEKQKGFIPYEQFLSREFTIDEDAQHISFGNNEHQCTGGAEASFLAYQVLNEIKCAKAGLVLSPPASPLARDNILETVNRFLIPGCIFPDPQIGGGLKAKAIGQCRIPLNEPILVIINSTNGKVLTLGLSGLYSSTDNPCKYVPYSEFPDRDFKVVSMELLSVGKGQYLPVEKTCVFVVATMLQELKDKVLGAY